MFIEIYIYFNNKYFQIINSKKKKKRGETETDEPDRETEPDEPDRDLRPSCPFDKKAKAKAEPKPRATQRYPSNHQRPRPRTHQRVPSMRPIPADTFPKNPSLSRFLILTPQLCF